MTTRAEIATEARDWVGTRWSHQAATKGLACDCVGLVVGVALYAGHPRAQEFLADPTWRNYGRQPDPQMLLAGCAAWLVPIPVREAGLGDILLMAFESDPQHFAIVSREEPRYIVHALAQARRVVEHRLDELWASRVVRAYRYPDLVDDHG